MKPSIGNEFTKKLICPRCHKFFATLDISDWPDISPKHIKIVAGRKNRKLRNGASLSCTLCSYEYTTHDVIIAGAFPDNFENVKPGCEP